MAEITLTAFPGRSTGTRNSRRLRAEAKVPGVVYGHGRDPLPVTVEWRHLRTALITDAGLNVLIDLDIEGEDGTQLSIIKEMQRHPIRHTVDHVDFLLISRDQEIAVEVPIILEGEATLVTNEQGLVEQPLLTLLIKAKPGDIPDQLTFDISNLTIGDTVTVRDLALPTGVTTDIDLDENVASAQVSRAALEVEAEEAAAEAAEGEEGAEGEAGGEAASGEAPSDGGTAPGGDEG